MVLNLFDYVKKMNVLSLFDGLSSGQIALNRLNLKDYNYYASEIEPNAIKVTMKNYPQTIQLGDVNEYKEWNLPKIDLLMGGSPCFAKGTLITTYRGLIPIEDVVKGDYVLTHKNRYKKVLTPMVKNNSGIYKLKIQGSNVTYATEEHPYYVREMKRAWNKDIKKVERVFSDPVWKNVKDLKRGDFIGFAKNEKSLNSQNLTKEECWLIGRYIADGYLRNDKRKNRINSYYYQVIYCVGKHKIDDFYKNVKEYYVGKSEERTAFKCKISSKRLVELCRQCGRGAENKKIPQFILDLPVDLLKIFMEGYLSGDGSCKNETYQATSVSKVLIYQLGQVVIKAYNTPYSISFYERPPITVIEGRTVNQKDTWTIRFSKEIKKQNQGVYLDGQLWMPVKEIEFCPERKEMVYNMEVEDDNSYVANNCIVHNCQSLSITQSKTRKNLDGKSKLFFKFVDALEHFKPKYFLFENVASMKKECRDVMSEILGCEPVEINSNCFTAQDRPRLYWTNIKIPHTGLEECSMVLKDIMDDNVAEKYFYKQDFEYLGDKKVSAILDIKGHDILKRVHSPNFKCHTLTACTGGNHQKKVMDNGRPRKLTPLEYERLQTVPDGYTEGVADTNRYNMLGNGWTVDVIQYILSYMDYKK